MKIQNHNVQTDNPLGSAPVGGLILKFSVPAIISMLVSALYNIVDQIFIGQGVGMLGNAATNVAFPVTIFSTAIALLLGIGGASSYNLESGAGHDEKASYIAGASLSMLGISGILISAAVLLFLDPLLHLFGGTPDVMPYAIDYTGITAVGIPFYILTTGGCHLIRADRSPGFSMTCMLTGAVINTVLDPLYFWLRMGHQRRGLGHSDRSGSIRYSCNSLFCALPQNELEQKYVPSPYRTYKTDCFSWRSFLF